jgi:hypothetical protein
MIYCFVPSAGNGPQVATAKDSATVEAGVVTITIFCHIDGVEKSNAGSHMGLCCGSAKPVQVSATSQNRCTFSSRLIFTEALFIFRLASQVTLHLWKRHVKSSVGMRLRP